LNLTPVGKVRGSGHASSVTLHQSRFISHAFAVAALLLAAASPAVAGEVEWKLLQDQAAAHLNGGSVEQAELFGRAALKEAESLGPGHKATEQSLSTLSHALSRLGKHEEAVALGQRLVAIRSKRYGADDPATGLALHNYAQFLILQGNLAAAEKAELRALAIFQKKLGAAHLNTAVALHNMGAIYLKQEKFKEGEKYLRQALMAKEKALKPGSLSIAHTLDNLAAALAGQGRQIEAAKYKRRADGIRQRVQTQKPGV
jgi:tetratricopeptide (TPR) repeat protein